MKNDNEMLHVVVGAMTSFVSQKYVRMYFIGYANDANAGPEWDRSLSKAHLFDNDSKDAQKIVDEVDARFKERREIDIFVEAVSKKDIMVARLKGS